MPRILALGLFALPGEEHGDAIRAAEVITPIRPVRILLIASAAIHSVASFFRAPFGDLSHSMWILPFPCFAVGLGA